MDELTRRGLGCATCLGIGGALVTDPADAAPASRGGGRFLIATADVLVENFKPGTLASLGFSYQRLRELNPDIVLAESSAYGDRGPWSGLCNRSPRRVIISSVIGDFAVQVVRSQPRPNRQSPVITSATPR